MHKVHLCSWQRCCSTQVEQLWFWATLTLNTQSHMHRNGSIAYSGNVATHISTEKGPFGWGGGGNVFKRLGLRFIVVSGVLFVWWWFNPYLFMHFFYKSRGPSLKHMWRCSRVNMLFLANIPSMCGISLWDEGGRSIPSSSMCRTTTQQQLKMSVIHKNN